VNGLGGGGHFIKWRVRDGLAGHTRGNIPQNFPVRNVVWVVSKNKIVLRVDDIFLRPHFGPGWSKGTYSNQMGGLFLRGYNCVKVWDSHSPRGKTAGAGEAPII